jgi:hypothetical protein
MILPKVSQNILGHDIFIMKILKKLHCNANVHRFGLKKNSILILCVLVCEKTIGHCVTKVCCDIFEQGNGQKNKILKILGLGKALHMKSSWFYIVTQYNFNIAIETFSSFFFPIGRSSNFQI